MSSSNSPCAACKFLRRKCTTGCVFAPYFPPDNPGKFAHVHRVFGASNVGKLLTELTSAQREDAVNSLAYEAEARLHDPVYGCVGYISILQHRLLLVQRDLSAAKKELAALIGPAAFGPFAPHHPFLASSMHPSMAVPAGMGMELALSGQQSGPLAMAPLMFRDHHQQHLQHPPEQHISEEQHLAEAVAVAREHEILRSIEQQQEMERLMGDGTGVIGTGPALSGAGASLPLALVSPQAGGFVVQQQHQGGKQQVEGNFHEGRGHYQHHNHHHGRGSHDGRSGVGPSS